MIAKYLQFAPTYLGVEENLLHAERLLDGAEADLIVLPELFQSGYFFQSEADLRSVAERIPAGPTTQRLQEWARQSGAVIVAGLAEQEGGDVYNRRSSG